jgi:hypothetical protein
MFAVLCVASTTAFADTSGGVTSPEPTAGTCNPSEPLPKAKLRDGKAYAPSCAPAKVKYAIAAGNQIRHKPYRMGGGHLYPWQLDTAYDCSGTVSWLLHGYRGRTNLISKPRTSGQLARWRLSGRGKWISVRANANHAYIVVAGLRMDTSGTGGRGPRWHRKHIYTNANGPFKTRHAKGY